MQRKIAFKIIYKTISEGAFTNLLLRSELEKFDTKQRGFITNLVYGVLKNYEFLCFQHEHIYAKTNLKNKVILSMAVYEKYFLNKEDYVVNNEYVNLADNEFDKKFINAILYRITELKEPQDDYLKNSLPKWIYSLLSKQYDKDQLNLILSNYKRIASTYYRVNVNKCPINKLSHLNIKQIDDFVFTSDYNLINTKEFKNGYFYIQDINASAIVNLIPFEYNDTFLDACSAPGSKLFNALEKIKDSNAHANDINENRLNLIKKQAMLLGYKDVTYHNIDARFLDKYFNMKFDKILLDVPCSGLGVIGRRPDIKFHIKPDNLDELELIQKDILDSAANIVKDNGYILYSTCTLNKKENEKQISKFLDKHFDYNLIEMKTIFSDSGDMFFMALLKKV